METPFSLAMRMEVGFAEDWRSLLSMIQTALKLPKLVSAGSVTGIGRRALSAGSRNCHVAGDSSTWASASRTRIAGTPALAWCSLHRNEPPNEPRHRVPTPAGAVGVLYARPDCLPASAEAV